MLDRNIEEGRRGKKKVEWVIRGAGKEKGWINEGRRPEQG